MTGDVIIEIGLSVMVVIGLIWIIANFWRNGI